MNIFIELSLIIFIATLVSLIMRTLKQPLIVGYILSGLICGPYALNIITSHDTIELFSKIGIIILLFIVGLNLNPQVIKEVGKVSALAGIAQVVLTSLVGFLIAVALGLSSTAAMYVAIALTLSSTIIILKLITDKGQLNDLYAKITVGVLIVQDIVASIILLFVSTVSANESQDLTTLALITILKGIVLLGTITIVSSILLPRLTAYVAQSQELLFLFSLCWGMCIAAIFYFFGFSVEIGALVAGVTLAGTHYAYEISSRLKPLRDFFVLLFFILLGSQMVITDLSQLLLPAIILSLFVLVGNPLIVIIIMNLLGYHRHIGFKAGLTVAQISEFSLILATLGMQIGHINQETVSLITLVGLITIAGSTYLMMYDDKIFEKFDEALKIFEIRKTKRLEKDTKKDYEAILFGFHRAGQDVLNAFKKLSVPHIVVDFNPESIKQLDEDSIPNVYGDAQDMEFLDELNLHKVKLIVSTIPDFKTNMLLVEKIREKNKKAIIIVLSQHIPHAMQLYEAGANYVSMPHYIGAQYIAKLIAELGLDDKAFSEEKEKHLKYINKHIASSRI
jgi:Kef-type K+ transport system membrane component KefB